MVKRIVERILNEPVALGAFIRTGILLVMAFGVQVTMEQLAAVMAFVEAGIALVTRASVTPNQHVGLLVTPPAK